MLFVFRPKLNGIIGRRPLIRFDGLPDLAAGLFSAFLCGVTDVFSLIGGFASAFLRSVADIFGFISRLARAFLRGVADVFRFISHLDQRVGRGVHRLINPARIL